MTSLSKYFSALRDKTAQGAVSYEAFKMCNNREVAEDK
jgi:sugar phosphate isomerase/epimerase